MPPSHQYRERDYEFANTLLSLRTTIGLTQGSLATLLGVSRRAVENWEQGLTTPKAEHLKTFLELCVRHAAFAAGHEEEQIRAFWKAARQKVLLDEYWLSDLLAQPSSSLSGNGGQDSAAASETLSLWTVPFLRNPHFTGREELLSQLEQQLAPRDTEPSTTLHHAALTQAQAIKGLGGIGKTQTAIEYAYRAREQGRYTHTLWISAASEEAVLASFVALKDWVPTLGQEEADQQVLANRALRWLEQSPHPWLLIYDNADETAYLPAYLPTAGRGSFLFTTRASAVGALAPSLEVDALPLEEGIQLLLRRAGRQGEVSEQEWEEARAIVLALSQLPLALDQAGAYLEETGCSLADYLQLYQQHQYELLARRGKQASGYPDSVATTWKLSFEQIEASDPAGAELLRLCAFVAPDDIPEELLTEGAPYWPAALQEAVRDRLRFNQVLSSLLSFSLIKRVGRERTLSLHQLVQVVQRSRMTPEEQRQWAQLLVQAVLALFPSDPGDFASWPVCQRLLSQALACSRLIERHDLRLPEAAEVLHRAGVYLNGRALHGLAEPLVRQALSLREQQLGPEHPDVATSLHHLGLLFWRLGHYTEAEPLFQRALRIREQALGPEHPLVGDILVGLARLSYEQGQSARTAQICQQALLIWEQRLPDHPGVAFPLHYLALVVAREGKDEEAERLERQALRIWEERLGSEHPHQAYALHGLATLAARQGRESEAEALFGRALSLREQRKGETHPETASVLHDFAGFQQARGRTQEAAALYQRALTTREQVLGPDHQLTHDTRARLQAVLAAMGQAPKTMPTET